MTTVQEKWFAGLSISDRKDALIRSGTEPEVANAIAAKQGGWTRKEKGAFGKAHKDSVGGGGGVPSYEGKDEGDFAWPLPLNAYSPADQAAYHNHEAVTQELVAIAQTAQGVSKAGLQGAFDIFNHMGDMPVFTWITLLSAITNKTFVAHAVAGILPGLTDVPSIFTMSDGTSNGEAGNFSALAMAGHALMNFYFHDTSGAEKPVLGGEFLAMYKAKTSESGLLGASANSSLKSVRRDLLAEQARVLGAWFPSQAGVILEAASGFEAGTVVSARGRQKLEIRSTRPTGQ